jgi:hypothetical protein
MCFTELIYCLFCCAGVGQEDCGERWRRLAPSASQHGLRSCQGASSDYYKMVFFIIERISSLSNYNNNLDLSSIHYRSFITNTVLLCTGPCHSVSHGVADPHHFNADSDPASKKYM